MADYEKFEDQLVAEYYHTFKEIEVYFKASELLDSEMEEVMSDILDMFLMAQSEGKSLKKVIGNNTEIFCRGYIKGMWKFPSIKTVIRYSGEWLAAIVVGIIVSLTIDYSNGRIHDVWQDKCDVSGILIFFLPVAIGCLIDKYIIKKKIFKNCINRENHIERKGWIAVGILVILLEWLCEKFDIKIYASLSESIFVLIAIAVIIILVYGIIRLAYAFSAGYKIKKKS